MQYSFIYQALLEYYLYGDTELDVSSLEGHLQKLHNTRAPLERLGLEEEFRVRASQTLTVYLLS
jgi:receptor-type tyrosine-protein phosphatase epsilon